MNPYPRQQDTYYMSLAISQAQKGQFLTRPNPSVGCVLVKNNTIIGAGYTSPVGGNHAEINALEDARQNNIDVQGATAYVTLEPCSHYGRTPPCARALVQAGIQRVVVAGLDANPQVAGNGIRMLEEAGVDVRVGVLTAQAELINTGFLKAMQTDRPYVRLKVATSLDGRTAMASGESKWITCDESREDVQRIRALSGAIITGSETVITDNPNMNVRSETLGVKVTQIPQPKPVIVDRRKRLDSTSEYKLCHNPETLFWREDNLAQLLTTLTTDYQIHDVLVEAGASLTGSFIQQGLFDELIVYQAPCILGITARPMLDISIDKLCHQFRLSLDTVTHIGTDVRFTFHRV